jgi:hypothetical protein
MLVGSAYDAGVPKGTCDFIRRTREWANNDIGGVVCNGKRRMSYEDDGFSWQVRGDIILEHLFIGLAIDYAIRRLSFILAGFPDSGLHFRRLRLLTQEPIGL